ncbi:unnamed protein product, partial [Discosporangium mesarthrocarpum]
RGEDYADNAPARGTYGIGTKSRPDEKKIVQCMEVEDESRLTVTDSETKILCFITDPALEEFSHSHSERTLASLRRSIIKLEAWEFSTTAISAARFKKAKSISQPLCILVFKLSRVSCERTTTMDNPVDLNKRLHRRLSTTNHKNLTRALTTGQGLVALADITGSYISAGGKESDPLKWEDCAPIPSDAPTGEGGGKEAPDECITSRERGQEQGEGYGIFLEEESPQTQEPTGNVFCDQEELEMRPASQGFFSQSDSPQTGEPEGSLSPPRGWESPNNLSLVPGAQRTLPAVLGSAGWWEGKSRGSRSDDAGRFRDIVQGDSCLEMQKKGCEREECEGKGTNTAGPKDRAEEDGEEEGEEDTVEMEQEREETSGELEPEGFTQLDNQRWEQEVGIAEEHPEETHQKCATARGAQLLTQRRREADVGAQAAEAAEATEAAEAATAAAAAATAAAVAASTAAAAATVAAAEGSHAGAPQGFVPSTSKGKQKAKPRVKYADGHSEVMAEYHPPDERGGTSSIGVEPSEHLSPDSQPVYTTPTDSHEGERTKAGGSGGSSQSGRSPGWSQAQLTQPRPTPIGWGSGARAMARAAEHRQERIREEERLLRRQCGPVMGAPSGWQGQDDKENEDEEELTEPGYTQDKEEGSVVPSIATNRGGAGMGTRRACGAESRAGAGAASGVGTESGGAGRAQSGHRQGLGGLSPSPWAVRDEEDLRRRRDNRGNHTHPGDLSAIAEERMMSSMTSLPEGNPRAPQGERLKRRASDLLVKIDLRWDGRGRPPVAARGYEADPLVAEWLDEPPAPRRKLQGQPPQKLATVWEWLNIGAT